MKAVRALIHGMTVVIFALLVITVLLQVVTRITGIVMPWTEEAARYLFVWLTYLAGYICVREGLNIYVDVVIDYLPKKAWKVLFILINVISVVYLGLLVVFGSQLAFMSMTQYSTVMRIPMGIVYLAIPIGALAMIIAQIEYFWRIMKERRA